MPSDSYYDRIDEAEDKAKNERKRKLVERLNKLTLEEKVEFLMKEYINHQH